MMRAEGSWHLGFGLLVLILVRSVNYYPFSSHFSKITFELSVSLK